MITSARTIARLRAQHERDLDAIAADVRKGAMATSKAVEYLLRKDGAFGGALNVRYMAYASRASENRWRAAICDIRRDRGLEVRPILWLSRYSRGIKLETLAAFAGVDIKGMVADSGQYFDVNRIRSFAAEPCHDAIRHYNDVMADAYNKANQRVPIPDPERVLRAIQAMGEADVVRRDPAEVESIVAALTRELAR